jgi:RecA-family ATPase
MIETDQFGNTSDAAFAHWLRSYVQANGPFTLVAIDPLSRFAGSKAETDNAAATRFIQACESVAALTGATVLIAHHTNKMSRAAGQLDSTAGRGSSAFVDGARWQSALSVEHLNLDDHEERQRLGDLVTFAVTKSNYAMKPEPILLRRDVDNGGALVLLDDADRELVQRSRSGSAARTAKTSEREAERERVRDVREQQKATRRAALAAAREAEARDRNDGDDEAAHQLIEANPRATVRALVALFRKARTCGGTRAHAAIVRVRRET